MNFQKFIYDFLKFNDFSANFNDILTRAEALKSGAMGVWYIFGVVWCKKQPLWLRAVGLCHTFGVQLRVARAQGFHSLRSFHRLPVLCRPFGTIGYREVEVWCGQNQRSCKKQPLRLGWERHLGRRAAEIGDLAAEKRARAKSFLCLCC